MFRLLNWFLALCMLGLVTTAPASAVSTTHVHVALDKTDVRFGKFYVPSIGSVLIRANAKAPTPTIVFLHGCGGIGGQTLSTAKIDAAEFAKLGYATLILDTDDDRHLGDKPCNIRDISFSLVGARVADLDTAARWLVDQHIAIAGKIVSLGTSLGGEVVLEHAQTGSGTTKLLGGIGYYPPCDRGGTRYARYPLLLLSGEQDFTDGPSKSLAEICKQYADDAAKNGGAHIESVGFPNATHSFDVIGQPTGVSQSLQKAVSGYDPVARKASMANVDAFLASLLK